MQVPQFLDSNSDRLDQISLSGQEKWAVESRRAGTMYYGCRETSGNFISRQKSGEFWRLWKIYKKLKVLENLHVKQTEGSMKFFWKVYPKVKIFDIFGNFHLIKSPKRNYCYFSDIQSTLGNTLMQFSRKSEPKIFDQNHWIPPTLAHRLW